jgi:small subunit ribosomal protein S17
MSETEQKKTSGAKRRHRAEKTGVVVSAKMQKTVVVAVERLVRHQLYHKIIRRTNRFQAHDELGASLGDMVKIVESRPLSRHKRWRVREIVRRASFADSAAGVAATIE